MPFATSHLIMVPLRSFLYLQCTSRFCYPVLPGLSPLRLWAPCSDEACLTASSTPRVSGVASTPPHCRGPYTNQRSPPEQEILSRYLIVSHNPTLTNQLSIFHQHHPTRSTTPSSRHFIHQNRQLNHRPVKYRVRISTPYPASEPTYCSRKGHHRLTTCLLLPCSAYTFTNASDVPPWGNTFKIPLQSDLLLLLWALCEIKHKMCFWALCRSLCSVQANWQQGSRRWSTFT